MIYEYNKKIVNNDSVVDFYKNKKFIGYILPDGSVFECMEHNISNVETSVKMYLELIDNNYSDKDELLNVDTNNKILQLIIKYLKTMSHEKIHALLEYIKKENLLLSDLLVSYFGCHLITRLKKEIITSETNHQCFYNYLLNDFKITTIDRIVYDENEKSFKRIGFINRNDYLYDEIKKIKNEVSENEIDLFYKTK